MRYVSLEWISINPVVQLSSVIFIAACSLIYFAYMPHVKQSPQTSTLLSLWRELSSGLHTTGDFIILRRKTACAAILGAVGSFQIKLKKYYSDIFNSVMGFYCEVICFILKPSLWDGSSPLALTDSPNYFTEPHMWEFFSCFWPRCQFLA